LPGDTLTLSAVGTAGTLGSVSLSNGDLSYTAPASGSSDAFIYTVSDQLHETATGSVGVSLLSSKGGTITLAGSGNSVVASNGNYSVTGGTGDFISLGGGNDSVSLPGNNNTVALGDGNDSVSLSGNNNTAALGNGNDSVSVLGNDNTVTLGNGNDTVSVAGTGNSLTLGSGHDTITNRVGGDSFTLDGSFASLMLQGSNNSVLVNGGSTSIWDTVGGTDALHLQIGPLGGTVGITNFSAANGVLALTSAMASSLGWTTPGQIDAAVTSDNHGGSLLSLGSNGSVDFARVAPASLHASNFQIV
jgi:hypothetical protein